MFVQPSKTTILVTYSRAALIPADKKKASILLETEGVKSIFRKLGLDVLPFKLTCNMMCAVVKDAVRARSYADASQNILEKYLVTLSSVQVEQVTNYVGTLVFKEQVAASERLKASVSQKIDIRRRRRRKNDILYLEAAGAMVHVRGKKIGDGWMESKHAIAFHSSNIHYYTSTDGIQENHRILKREFVGYIGSAADSSIIFSLWQNETTTITAVR